MNQYSRFSTEPGEIHCYDNNHHDLSFLPELRRRVRNHVNAVIQCLPTNQTKSYMEALRVQQEYRDEQCQPQTFGNVAPPQQMIEMEMDPLPFVRYCDYDIYGGARRLCLYWTERLKLFGPERAYLPLTLTGTGALTPQDLSSMRAGYPALLPDAQTGQPCFLFDRRCKLPNSSVESLIRCMFYIFKVMAENDFSQVTGALAFVVAATQRSKEGDMDWSLVHRVTSLVSSCFPVKVNIHLLSMPQQRKPTYASKVIDFTKYVLRQYLQTSSILNVHLQTHECPKDKIFNELKKLGLQRKGIPLLYGGEWTMDNFFEWCQSRMEWEFETYKQHLIQPLIIGGNWVKITQRINANNPSSVCVASNESTSAEYRKKNMSQPDEIGYTAKKVKKTRTYSTAATNSKAASVEAAGKVDPREQHRLEELIRSRRKRERQRAEFNSLKEESSQLIEKNLRLKQEYQRLTCLLHEAEQSVAQLTSLRGFPTS